MYQRPETSYLTKLMLLMCFTGAGMAFGSLFAGLLCITVYNIPFKELGTVLYQPGYAGAIRLMQTVSSIICFGIPAIVYSKIVTGDPLKQFKFSKKFSITQILLIVLICFAALLTTDLFAQINSLIPLPDSWATMFKKMENDSAKAMLAIGNMHNAWDFLLTLFVLAILPAFLEEMIFRGCLQQIFVGWTRKVFVGILITSIIFSAFHVSYYGFLPRLFLGIVLGYIFYIGNNIWWCILAHFLNNAWAVTVMYILSKSGKLTAESMNGTPFPYYIGLAALAATVLLLFLLKKTTGRSQELEIRN